MWSPEGKGCMLDLKHDFPDPSQFQKAKYTFNPVNQSKIEELIEEVDRIMKNLPKPEILWEQKDGYLTELNLENDLQFPCS